MEQKTDVERLKNQFIAALQAEIDKLQEQVDAKQDALDAILDAFRTAPVGKPEMPKVGLYYVHSRSGDTNGHFITDNSGSVECWCPGFKYNGKCWASTYIKNAGPTARTAYKYQYGYDIFGNFALQVPPLDCQSYLPTNAISLQA